MRVSRKNRADMRRLIEEFRPEQVTLSSEMMARILDDLDEADHGPPDSSGPAERVDWENVEVFDPGMRPWPAGISARSTGDPQDDGTDPVYWFDEPSGPVVIEPGDLVVTGADGVRLRRRRVEGRTR